MTVNRPTDIPVGTRACDWSVCDDQYEAGGDTWDIFIDAHQAPDLRWGERGSLERSWRVDLWPSGWTGSRLTSEGTSTGLAAAKRDALNALRQLANDATHTENDKE